LTTRATQLLRPSSSILSLVFSKIHSPPAARIMPLAPLFSTNCGGDNNDATHTKDCGKTITPPIWMDTDVGFDDLVAIGCCSCPGEDNASTTSKSIVGISTVGGGLTPNPSDGVAILKGLFASSSSYGDVPIVSGRTNQKHSNRDDTDNDPSWLAKCRFQLKDFCASQNISIPSDSSTRENDEATSALRLSIQKHHDKGKMDLVCLGPLTNLAHWLDDETKPEWMASNIKSIWILGGNLPTTPDSRASSVEFNFGRDPKAVQRVLQQAATNLKGTTIYIVPQEVCDRQAFEVSFLKQQHQKDSMDHQKAASSIIDDWLSQSFPNPSSLLEIQQEESRSTNDVVALSSLLPSWMVKVTRTRSFSVYGDPICLYVRDQTYALEDSQSNTNTNRPKILWKEYYTQSNCGGHNDTKILAVEEDGRLVVRSPEDKDPSNNVGKHRQDRQGGSTIGTARIRIPHKVELGPVYMDWLAKSLLSSSLSLSREKE